VPSSRKRKIKYAYRDNRADDDLENTGDCGDDRINADADGGNDRTLECNDMEKRTTTRGQQMDGVLRASNECLPLCELRNLLYDSREGVERQELSLKGYYSRGRR